MPGEIDACVEIVRGLPDFFTGDVPERVRDDIGRHRCRVVVERDRVRGFAVAQLRGPHAAEILWAAVAAEHRHQGFGSALIDGLLRELAAEGVALVEAKTLDRSAGYAPYEATSGFWRSRGFVQIDTIDPMPGWEPGKPSAILVAALAATTDGHVTTPRSRRGPLARSARPDA